MQIEIQELLAQVSSDQLFFGSLLTCKQALPMMPQSASGSKHDSASEEPDGDLQLFKYFVGNVQPQPKDTSLDSQVSPSDATGEHQYLPDARSAMLLRIFDTIRFCRQEQLGPLITSIRNNASFEEILASI
jgi:hypothetical protein